MSRRPASFTQADVARVIRAAKQAGVSAVEVRSGETVITVRLTPSTGSQDETDADRVVPL